MTAATGKGKDKCISYALLLTESKWNQMTPTFTLQSFVIRATHEIPGLREGLQDIFSWPCVGQCSVMMSRSAWASLGQFM